MIDEEETFRKFGYHAHGLTSHSGKRIIAVCNDCGKIREIKKDDYHDLCRSCAGKGPRNHSYGKHLSTAHKQKIAESEKGEKNHNYDKHLSKVARKKMSVAHEGKEGYWQDKKRSEETKQKIKEAAKKQWQNEEYIKKVMEAINAKPNKLEEKLDAILSELMPNEFAYNGDFSQGITINRRIPDFVNLNGHKRIIELFGELFHSPFQMLKRKIPSRRRYNETIKDYKKCGYKCIIFWGADIKRSDAEVFVKSKLQKAGWLS